MAITVSGGGVQNFNLQSHRPAHQAGSTGDTILYRIKREGLGPDAFDDRVIGQFGPLRNGNAQSKRVRQRAMAGFVLNQ